MDKINTIEQTKVIEKARNVVEYGKKEHILTKQEYKWLEENGGAFFLAYKVAVDFLNKKERRELEENEYER